MRFSLLVNASPGQGQAQLSALRFAEAVLAAGHELSRVFFYGEAVLAGNRLNAPPGDETDITARWQALTKAHGVELSLCVAAALRRGVLNAEEALRWEKVGDNLAPGFALAGLGQLIEAMVESERLVEFS